jgi:flagellar biosynthetic protein FlhB
MSEQFGDKMHAPTPHRRQKAREQGHVARSHDLGAAITLVGALGALWLLGAPVVDYVARLAQRQLGGQAWMRADPDLAVHQWNLLSRELGSVVLPILGVLVILAVGANVGQFGLLWVPEKAVPDLGRIDPFQGLRRIFSWPSMVRVGLGVLKIVGVAGAGLWSVWTQREAIFALTSLEIPYTAVLIIRLIFSTCLWMAGALLVLALADYGYQRWRHEQDLRMTAHELREEMKMYQGDPQVLARRRAVQQPPRSRRR